MRVGFLIIIFETALLLLAFLPYAEEDTTRYVELISYLSLILPLYVAIQRKFWNFISLLSLTAVIHIIRDLCGSFDTCLNKYEDLKWNTLDDWVSGALSLPPSPWARRTVPFWLLPGPGQINKASLLGESSEFGREGERRTDAG